MAHLGFLLMDVDVPPISTCTHGTCHHVVQLEESTGQGVPRGLPSALPWSPAPTAPPYLLQDEIQADALLPVNVRVSEARQLLGVPPVHLHLHLGLRLSQLPGTGQG